MATNAQFPEEQNATGEFERQEDAFRNWITNESSARHPLAKNRYHLYVSLACPWASRTLIVHHLKRLQEVVGVTVVNPVRDERGWAFGDEPGEGRDDLTGFRFLREAYWASDPNFRGRVTVPVLWDTQERVIVNNSEDDICRMFDGVFSQLSKSPPDLFPPDIAKEQEELSAFVYDKVNNGVYKAGFASSQRAYAKAAGDVFRALEELEERLATQRYLFGNRIVETDWRLFCTLVRFDAVYYVHFKCNVRRIVDYPNLDGYLRDLYQQTGIAETVNMDHIKRHYYMTHQEINPTRIVPIGPELNFDRPHGRQSLNKA
ncbi:MAG TPA: glutathione S-transferase C-terminal domain-containing protein [Candidatus Saccharimonadales bacterium]|nr:glutathione S-transferase C-terminal domain-containing protein [Candidatus Saccharimonadales bacterium]